LEHFGYTVRTLDRLGVSAIIIEDKTGLKKNSLLDSTDKHEQDSIEVFCEKIKVGHKHRVTQDFMIIARIGSLILGKSMQDALDRAKAYIKAGVDGIMIHSKSAQPLEVLEFAQKYKSFEDRVPLVAVPNTYNSISFEELSSAGFNIVVYAKKLMGWTEIS
jgi:2-methylisocitrate lyase-like PEP mutase family enzyme